MLRYRWVKSVEIAWQAKNIPLNDYVSGIEQELLKNYLAKAEIAIFSVEEIENVVALEWNNLYELSVDVDVEGEKYNLIFVLQTDGKIKDAFHKMLEVYWVKAMDVNYIKPYWLELEEEKLDYIITKLQEESWKVEKVEKKQQKKQKKYLDSKNMKVLKKQIEDILEESKKLQWLCEKYPVLSTKKLETLSGELLKWKRSSNTSKIIEYYQDVLKEVEYIRSQYFDIKEQWEIEELKDDININMWVVREYKKFEKVNKMKIVEKLGSSTKFSQSELLYYKIFGKFGIHMKVIGKELYITLRDKFKVIPNILTDIELLLILVIIEYLLVISYKFVHGDFISNPEQINAIYYILLQVWVLWLSISVWKNLGYKSLQRWLLSIVLIAFTYFFIRYFITVNLAL